MKEHRKIETNQTKKTKIKNILKKMRAPITIMSMEKKHGLTRKAPGERYGFLFTFASLDLQGGRRLVGWAGSLTHSPPKIGDPHLGGTIAKHQIITFTIWLFNIAMENHHF